MKRFLSMHLLKSLLLIIGLVFFSATSFAQKQVSGKVVDESGMTLPGVSVMEKGTTNGTITGMDGDYTLTVANSATLVFSYMGFDNVEISAANGTTFNVTLKENTREIDEVVVVGYGTMKKSDVSGSSISVGAEDIEGFVGAGIDQALQGKAAGVQVTANSGQPGGGMQVSIRGNSTINPKDASPLYVIDGVPLQAQSNSGNSIGLNLGNGEVGSFSALSNLSPDDIESMEILKDASATAIYGSRAANGVVLITTKQGKKGKAQFNYSGSFGIQKQYSRIDMMNLREYAQFKNQVEIENGEVESKLMQEYKDPSLLGEGTDWQDAIFQTAFMHTHNLSASGGTDKAHYYISGGYFNQDGTMIGTKFDRYNTRINLDAQVTDWLKIGANSAFAVSHDELIMNNSEDGILTVATWSLPDLPVYDIDGNYGTVSREGVSGWKNPVADALNKENKIARKNIDATMYADIRITGDLNLHSEYSTSNLFTNSYAFTPSFDYGNLKSDQISGRRGKYENSYWQVKNFLTYNKTFADVHSVTAMIGQETSKWSWESAQTNGSGLSSNEIHNPALGTEFTIGNGFGAGTRVSMFGRVFYGFNSKYNLTYTYRRDASSNFGPENRWGNFHSMSASWKISNEDFFAPVKESLKLSNTRLRIGWGQVGNDNIAAYSWGANGDTYTIGSYGSAYILRKIANPRVQWETQESWNFGLDLGFLRDRFQFIFEYYSKVSKDMLMTAELPSYMGTGGNAATQMTAPVGNFGEMSNKGVEITFSSTNIDKKGLKWTTDFQFSHNKNELVNMNGSGNQNLFGYPQWHGQGQIVSCTTTGQALYQFYGYEVDGIYQNYEDIVNSPRFENEVIDRTNGVWIGDIKYKDRDGDGVITEADKTFIGDPNPKFTFGLTNTVTYKGFEFSLFINGSYGNDILNYNKARFTSMHTQWANYDASVLDRSRLVCADASIEYPRTVTIEGKDVTVESWIADPFNTKIENPGSDMPRFKNDGMVESGRNTKVSTRYVEDGSYIKIKTISLGYNFPKTWIQPLKLQSAKLYASITNLHTFTKYTGLDPEVGVSATTPYVMGVDCGRYPSPTIYTFGLNLQF